MPAKLKIGFAGTPEIAKVVLEKILSSGFKVDLVLTMPDRPANRGKKITPSPVKELALQHNLNILQPESFKKQPEILDIIQRYNLDIIVVVAYGLILPKSLLQLPALGCVNIHVSLLPAYRGAAPIQRAVLDGMAKTGVTIMQMDEGLDTGPILLQKETPIEPKETSGSLHDKLAILGAEMIIDYLTDYKSVTSISQPVNGVSYASKIEKLEAKINWNEEASIIERKIRGFNPFPGCFSSLDGQLIKVWAADVGRGRQISVAPGSIIEASKTGILVACGNMTVLSITELQDAGRNRQLAAQYILGKPNLVNMVFMME